MGPERGNALTAGPIVVVVVTVGKRRRQEHAEERAWAPKLPRFLFSSLLTTGLEPVGMQPGSEMVVVVGTVTVITLIGLAGLG